MAVTRFPVCFPSRSLYDSWLALAERSAENVSPCNDCSSKYRNDMEEVGRCRRDEVRIVFRSRVKPEENA